MLQSSTLGKQLLIQMTTAGMWQKQLWLQNKYESIGRSGLSLVHNGYFWMLIKTLSFYRLIVSLYSLCYETVKCITGEREEVLLQQDYTSTAVQLTFMILVKILWVCRVLQCVWIPRAFYLQLKFQSVLFCSIFIT